MIKDEIINLIDNMSDKLCQISSNIWDYAETKFEEYRSAELFIEVLEKEDFVIERNVAGMDTAFKAFFGKGSPVICILGEYDALSGMSQKCNLIAKENIKEFQNGHGCGHNLLGTACIGAVIAVKEYIKQNKLEGTICFFGCPGEEGGSGKTFMVRDGVFNGTDVALTWHPSTFNGVMGYGSLANYQVKIKFKGISSHAAATPHLGRSALDGVELMNVGVNYLREHIIQEARIHYAITDTGGFSPNVVQSSAEVRYLIRGPEVKDVIGIYERVIKIAKGAALMTETDYEINFEKACSNLILNSTLEDAIYKNLRKINFSDYTPEETKLAQKYKDTLTKEEIDFDIINNIARLLKKEEKQILHEIRENCLMDTVIPYNQIDLPIPGSTDVGDVSWVVPTAQFGTTCYPIGTPPHSWQITSQGKTKYANRGMLNAAKILAMSAIDILHDKNIVDMAKKELEVRLNNNKYICPIPKSVKPIK